MQSSRESRARISIRSLLINGATRWCDTRDPSGLPILLLNPSGGMLRRIERWLL
jgi:hypothetical protein